MYLHGARFPDQTFAYVERVATTKILHDVEALTLDLR